MKKIFSLNKKILFVALSMLSIVGYGVLVFAAAPNGGYAPGSTLDPLCAPGDPDCFVTLASGGAVSIGDLIGGSVDPNSILYTNGDSELAIDDLFTRNSATKETTIARTFEGVPTTEMNITIKPVFYTASSNNNLQEGETFETIPSGVTGTISRIENLLSPETRITATTPVFSGSGTNDLNVQEWDFNGAEPKNYTVTIIEKNAERATVSMNGIAFSVGETITGQTSGVTAEVVYSDNNYNIAFKNASGVFEYGETITSASTSGTIYPTGNSTDVFTISNSGYPTRGITYDSGQARVDGVYVTFSNDFGHEIGDQWTFTVSESPVQYQILFLDNVSGITQNSQDYQIVGQTSLATTSEGMLFVNPIGAVGDNVITWSLSGEDGEDDPTSMGVITAINGEVYTVSGTGNPAQNDVFMNYNDDDNVSFVYSVNTNPVASLITTGFMSSNNILGLGVKGTGFVQTNNNSGIFSGVYDASLYGGSEMSFASSYFGPNNELAQFTISGGVAPVISLSSSNSSDDAALTITPTSFLLETKQNGNTLFGFEATASTIGWRSGNERYFLPTTMPNNGDILTVTSVSGTDITLGFSAGGGGGSSPISLNNTTLYSSGLTSTGNYDGNNIFLGSYAGFQANASGSNFLGQSAGYGATGASNSNFFGTSAGNGATGASNSNFLGQGAGYGATGAYYSNFLGFSAGDGATGAFNSNFLGSYAGQYATSAYNSNFLGLNAGNGATDASGSNFLGSYAGNSATSASFSNFLGYNAGQYATSAYNSNFLGLNAGNGATDASGSNFLGSYAGINATNASNSNFLGQSAGNSATSAYNSNFFGDGAGYYANNASNSIFIGKSAGNNDLVNNTGSPDDFSILIGPNTSTGNNGSGVGYSNSIALGGYATNTASNQFMIGSAIRPINDIIANGTGSLFLPIGNDLQRTAYATDGAIRYNTDQACLEMYSSSAWACLGGGSSGPFSVVNGTSIFSTGLVNTGLSSNAGNSFFVGDNAGDGATNASNSNFFGQSAGYYATSASNSNFLGLNAGNGATNASNSNFFGVNAGYGAINASSSNFFGVNAGYGAINASSSNFIGTSAGYSATGARRSIFIGDFAGWNDSVDNVSGGGTSILIGADTSTGGYSNSIAIGGSAVNTASNQFMIGSSTRPINQIVMVASGGTTCATDINGTACSSDERLKTNITDLTTGILDKVVNTKTVTFNWNNNTDTTSHIGFIAQDIQQYFPELVSTGSTGYLSVNYAGMTPVLVQAIREMNLKITTINDMATPNTWRDSLIAWFGNVENGIAKLFVKEIETKTLCVADDTGDKTCITKAQLDQLLNNSAGGSITPEPSQPSTPEGGDGNTSTDDLPEVDATGTVNTGETSVDSSTPGVDEGNGAPIDTPAPETSDDITLGDSSTSGNTAPEESVSL